MKQKLLEQVAALKDCIEMESIQGLINIIGEMGFKHDGSSLVYEYTRELLIEFISEYIKYKKLDALRIKRNGEYGMPTQDTYQLCKEGLYRNGHNTKWDSVGKLYQAYKFIIEKNAKNKK